MLVSDAGAAQQLRHARAGQSSILRDDPEDAGHAREDARAVLQLEHLQVVRERRRDQDQLLLPGERVRRVDGRLGQPRPDHVERAIDVILDGLVLQARPAPTAALP
eukprot:4184460-Prymnesium_polylepis.1